MADDFLTGIDIVIPNWNGRHMLEVCLPSLYSQNYQDFTVYIVDNGSTDESVDFLRTTFPDVEILELKKNRGFSLAVNSGIEAGRREWVLLLNNDIEMAPNCLAHLAQQAEREPRIRMFALKMLSFSNRTLLDGAGDGVMRGGVGYRLGTMEPDSTQYNLKREVFGACAGAALYHRSLYSEVGLFDEDFFAYLEDVDFNMRAVRAGYRCCYLPGAVVFHIGSATTGSKINKMTVRLTTRNNIYVICKNFAPSTLIRFLPSLLVYQCFWFAFVVKERQLFGYLAGIFEAIPRILVMTRKRQKQDRATLSETQFRNRVIGSEREVVKSIMSRRNGEGKNNLLLRWYLAIFC
ncbi:MAG: glycosyltransferase family 2 protein [Desulfofustis sp.]|nr:glycosyltransferase family 2 protein [Desulfofustis sp.]